MTTNTANINGTNSVTSTTNSVNVEKTKTVKVYWRRLGVFPAVNIDDIEVVTNQDVPAHTYDTEWNEMVVSDCFDIDYALGLWGDMNRPELVADAIIVSAAIHRHLGLTPTPWDYECLWRKSEFDSHDESEAEQYFAAVRAAYGEDTELLARKRYAE